MNRYIDAYINTNIFIYLYLRIILMNKYQWYNKWSDKQRWNFPARILRTMLIPGIPLWSAPQDARCQDRSKNPSVGADACHINWDSSRNPARTTQCHPRTNPSKHLPAIFPGQRIDPFSHPHPLPSSLCRGVWCRRRHRQHRLRPHRLRPPQSHYRQRRPRQSGNPQSGNPLQRPGFLIRLASAQSEKAGSCHQSNK